MMQLNEVTQQNASASEQLAATAEELGSQAEQLQELMTFFHLGQDDGNRRSSSKITVKPASRSSHSHPSAVRAPAAAGGRLLQSHQLVGWLRAAALRQGAGGAAERSPARRRGERPRAVGGPGLQ